MPRVNTKKYLFVPARLGAKLPYRWDFFQNTRERPRSPKIEKLRASRKLIWAKITILTFMLISLFKNKARKHAKIWYECWHWQILQHVKDLRPLDHFYERGAPDFRENFGNLQVYFLVSWRWHHRKKEK